MESNIGRNKLCMRLIVREFCLMSGQEMVLSAHIQNKPVFLKMGCPALNILWFCHKNTTCRQQEILQEDKTLLQLSQKANGCIQGLSPFRIPTLWRVLVLDPSPRSSVVTQNETQSLLHTVSMIRINGIFLMSLVFWGFFTTEQQ